MNNKLLLSISVAIFSVIGTTQISFAQEKISINKKGSVYNAKPDKKTKKLRRAHARFLANSPFKKTLQMSKSQRSDYGLPPNKYLERIWELSIDPATGKTYPEKVNQLQEKISNNRLSYRAPGDASDNQWVERGPNNVGGRTRALLFDPNDSTKKKVYAGSASGGLWVNNDITTSTSGWTRVAGVPGNLNVSCITVDPNNSNIWYLGTGEQYTFGDAVGSGVYKTTDGGLNWVKVPITFTGSTFTNSLNFLTVAGIFYIQDIIARNNAGTTEIYIGVGSSVYGSAGFPNNLIGTEQSGLYKSTNGGTTWTKNTDANMVNIVADGRNYYEIPNDLELDANNNIWFSTTRLTGVGAANTAKIYKSTDGNTWTIAQTIANARRTEIEPSVTNANKMYVLYQSIVTTTTGTTTRTSSIPALLLTTNGFTTTSTITLPDDVDLGIPANDFTRGQSFYDLVIESDPTNDAIVYIGGIDLFRSGNSGTSWSQISKWSNNNNLAALTCSLVHADQHVMAFRPGFPNQAIFGNDGGVYYATSLSTAATNAVIPARIKDYNVTQFYSIGVASTNSVSGLTGDNFLAGAQDNGTQYFANPSTTAPASSVTAQGGDGAYSFFDQGADKYYISNFVYNQSIVYRTTSGTTRTINSESASNGDFICPMALDSNLDRLYADYTSTTATGTIYQIRRYSNIKTGTVVRRLLTSPLLTNSATAMRVSKFTTGSTTLLVGTANGKVLIVTNANTNTPTWTDITGSGFVGSISDVEFGQNESQIFVTFHNYGVTSIWYTRDRGVTWASIEGNFPDIPVKCILQNPLNTAELIIGTDLGVWNAKTFDPASSSSQALTWKQSYNGMSDVKVLDLQLRNDNKVFAATYGRGVFSGSFTAAAREAGNIENDFNELVTVFPTLVKNENITIASKQSLGQTTIDLFDLAGKKVYTNTIILNGSEQNITVGALTAGNYIMKLSANNFTDTKRIVIE
jgi:ribosomal protein S13